MARPPEPGLGDASNDRALGESLAETGPGLPDEAVGPEQRSLPDQMELADAAELRAIEQKLRAELQARRIGDEEAAAADPTGHA